MIGISVTYLPTFPQAAPADQSGANQPPVKPKARIPCVHIILPPSCPNPLLNNSRGRLQDKMTRASLTLPDRTTLFISTPMIPDRRMSLGNPGTVRRWCRLLGYIETRIYEHEPRSQTVIITTTVTTTITKGIRQ
jgi:hypothetical protein